MNNIEKIKHEIKSVSDPQKAKILQRFFKTEKGEYGEGDIFLGISVPKQRKIAKRYKHLKLSEIQELLNSKYHEHRLIALLILVEKFPSQKDAIYKFYLKNTKHINNWDLVDLSAEKIIGRYLIEKNDISILKKLAKSKNLWARRIAILATFHFIKNQRYKECFTIAKLLLNDEHDLIHKAVGWMLREVGKRISEAKEEEFLHKYYKTMPRMTLRYAIERFSKNKRRQYLT
ncbi:MAG: DNA alkylation repair protein [candidate division WOR-3 bacterium]